MKLPQYKLDGEMMDVKKNQVTIQFYELAKMKTKLRNEVLTKVNKNSQLM